MLDRFRAEFGDKYANEEALRQRLRTDRPSSFQLPPQDRESPPPTPGPPPRHPRAAAQATPPVGWRRSQESADLERAFGKRFSSDEQGDQVEEFARFRAPASGRVRAAQALQPPRISLWTAPSRSAKTSATHPRLPAPPPGSRSLPTPPSARAAPGRSLPRSTPPPPPPPQHRALRGHSHGCQRLRHRFPQALRVYSHVSDQPTLSRFRRTHVCQPIRPPLVSAPPSSQPLLPQVPRTHVRHPSRHRLLRHCFLRVCSHVASPPKRPRVQRAHVPRPHRRRIIAAPR
jgi:hypothetical protein